MGLTCAEIHHVNSLRAQLVGLRDYCHRGRRFYTIDPFRQSQSFRRCRGHAFLFLLLGTSTKFASNLYAGSSFARTFCSTASGTSPFTGPPTCATSRTSLELTYEYLSAGIMKTVSSVGSILRFINAICNSYS